MSQVAPQQLSPRSARTQRRILESASQCFALRGFSKTTVEEVARAAGVSKGLVYHHFGGKTELLEALLEQTLEAWSDASNVVEHLAKTGNVRRALETMVLDSLAFARENPLMHALFQLDPHVVLGLSSSASVRNTIEKSRQRLVQVIEVGIESGEIRAGLDPIQTTNVVRLVIMALIEHLLDPKWIDGSDEIFVSHCLHILFGGLFEGESA
ncbi:MAG: TetR/AcrR family transcriptional regulator [Myxococcota bacterium]|nr:TetR/AcrR family transcriptional regulator [Myxococcota bacterium]